MKLIDVTFRDGGHQNGFTWPKELVSRYIQTLEKFPEIDFVEFGYWKQYDKYDGDFYRINESLLAEIGSKSSKDISIMVDYHYCSHDVRDFPQVKDFDRLGLIRVCLRKQDIVEGCAFIKKLRDYTGAKVSINFFNITNYSEDDIFFACEHSKDTNAEYMYFADTHGSLDLPDEASKFAKFTKIIKSNDMIPGLHLHDHSGKAYLNYRTLEQVGFGATDVSLGGVGKGMGNLKFEHVLDLRQREFILDFLTTESKWFKMPKGPYGLLTARDGITDHYAVEAEKYGIHPSEFAKLLKSVNGVARDVFDKTLLRKKS